MYELLFMNHRSLILFRGYGLSFSLSLFSSFFSWTFMCPILYFSFHAFLSMSFICFCIAHILFLMITFERESGNEATWSFNLWVDGWSSCYLPV
jgi:hypothetical protein